MNQHPQKRPKKLLDQVRDAIRRKHYSTRTGEEVQRVLDAMSGTHRLIAQLLYGSGLRLSVQKAARSAAKEDVRTTMIYTHVLNRGAMAVRSPLD